MLADGGFDGLQAHPVAVQRHADRTHAPRVSDVEQAQVGRVGRDQGVTLAEHRLHDEIERLLRPAGDQHVIGLAADAQRRHVLGHAGAQGRVAVRFLIGDRCRPVAVQHQVKRAA